MFTRDGVVNFRNQRVWTDENSHAVEEKGIGTDSQPTYGQAFLAIDQGSFVLPQRLTGARYQDFLLCWNRISKLIHSYYPKVYRNQKVCGRNEMSEVGTRLSPTYEVKMIMMMMMIMMSPHSQENFEPILDIYKKRDSSYKHSSWVQSDLVVGI
ncbi:hypothetical protein ANN_23422 [Periplaneta americana]|uniref:Uncharacterized protein n=1 Tax=Periplaneta americana TaxID=6978 RepID=A0ABQ8SM35_PERAM|nr:hypothetical protein ANN_23422 [Periplaneta americana]